MPIEMQNHLQNWTYRFVYGQHSYLSLIKYHKVDILEHLDYRHRSVRVNFGV